MSTCEFCMFAGDECYLLHEPIEYEPSGMTIMEDCPLRHDTIQISRHKREVVRGEDEPHK